MATEIKIYQGKIKRNIYENWSDVDTGLFIDTDTLEDIFKYFEDKTVKIIIEEIEN